MKLWIARNKNRTIYAYDAIPIKNAERFEARGKYAIYFPDNFFKELTWENSPKIVELKVVNG